MDLFWLEKLWHSKWSKQSWQSKDDKEIKRQQSLKKNNYLNQMRDYFDRVKAISQNYENTSPRKLTFLAKQGSDGVVDDLSIFVGEAKADIRWKNPFTRDQLVLSFFSRGEAALGLHTNKVYSLHAEFADLAQFSWVDQKNALYFVKEQLEEFVLLELCKISSYYETLFDKEPSSSQKDKHDRFF